MSRIVYLFGAGASFGKRSENDKDEITEGLPIVTEFPTQIDKLINLINIKEEEDDSQARPWEFEELKAELLWLKGASISHQTIDTYAKKLWVTEKGPNYAKLKSVISVFLTLEQLFNKPDSRYDAFFANIIGSSINELPKDVSILSWNYDCQFEKAFSNYLPGQNINTIWKHLNIKGKTTEIRTNSKNGFSITKINGTALSFESNAFESQFFDPHFGRQGDSEIRYVHWAQLKGADNVKNALSFAWEGTNPNFYEEINEKVKDTEVLVIIGYSFPFFNRGVDRKIIKSMEKLKKIYIQDPFCKDVKESLEAVLSDEQLDRITNGQIKIILRENIKQFLVPNEM
jgi:hypothetical protein